MSEYFIVLANAPNQHETLPEALAQQRALQAHFPDKIFTVHRCKTWLTGAKHFTKMVELMRDIHREGLTAANSDRLRLLLVTIGTRTPKLEALIRVDGPPEFGAVKGDICRPVAVAVGRAKVRS